MTSRTSFLAMCEIEIDDIKKSCLWVKRERCFSFLGGVKDAIVVVIFCSAADIGFDGGFFLF
jgi:TFIIF-interacting CTD phosphatase-like protein